METSGLLEAIRSHDVDRVTRILFTDDGNTKKKPTTEETLRCITRAILNPLKLQIC